MENLSTYDFRTEFQKRRDERREKAVYLFNSYRAIAMPGTSNTAVMRAVACNMGCSLQNIRVMLINAGVLSPRKCKRTNH